MTLTDEHIAAVRRVSLAAVGLCCLSYAGMAVAQNRPDPFLWYIPGVAGILAALVIFAAFVMAPPNARRMANDEMYKETAHRAQRHSYWLSVGMYPIFALLVLGFDLSWNTVFAAMGTLTGAAYLLLVTFYDLRQS